MKLITISARAVTRSSLCGPACISVRGGGRPQQSGMVPIHPAEKPDTPHVIATLTASVGNVSDLRRRRHVEEHVDEAFDESVTRRNLDEARSTKTRSVRRRQPL